MALHKIKKGLDIPITGEPNQQTISNNKEVTKVALLGEDYVGMKPTMHVQVGDTVKLGQVVFSDKKIPGIKYTAPAAGKVIEINRGEKRKFLSLVIALEGNEEVTFNSYTGAQINNLEKEKVISQLVESGLWTSIRVRPFGKIANPEIVPHSLFITAMDTEPLAPSVEKILEGKIEFFKSGLFVLSKLTDGKIYICKKPDEKIPTVELNNLSVEEFSGPHPAGLPGTHIHFLDPVDTHKKVWYVNAQDVATIGELFTTGKLNVERVIALAGPKIKNPRLIKTRLGASVEELIKGELKDQNSRVISGSVLSGRKAVGVEAYLGKFHNQISAVQEGEEKKFLGWLTAGANLFSVKKVMLSGFIPGKKFEFNTALHGGRRPVVPIGSYEKVMPLDILPTYLLRSLLVKDIEEAEKLGMLELVEEDLALCTFVCPSKIDYGPILRENLNIIEKEG